MANGTVIQKILKSHIVSGNETPGERIKIQIDQTLTQDATGTMAYLQFEAMGIERVKTEISVSYVDHNMAQNGPENNNDHIYLQSIAASKGIYFSRPGNGICHQVHLERFAIPGKTLLGSDSHTPSSGGLGMISIGAGGLDVALAMAGSPFQIAYPFIIGVKLEGKLPEWVTAKDVILKLLSILTSKGNVGTMIEYFGSGVAELSVPERATITNMGAELGVTTSVFPSDTKTYEFMKAQNREKDWKEIIADSNAVYDRFVEIDLTKLEPLAACPSSPDNIKSIKELDGKNVGQIIVGSCTNSSFQDLMLVSQLLKGKTVAPQTSFCIAPGSRQVLSMLAENGALASLIQSGARILESACGPCIGQGLSPADNMISIRTFNRNFAGRTGTKNDQVYLVSPLIAAVSALTGKITDPIKAGLKCPKVKNPEKYLINDDMIIPPSEEGNKIEIIRKPTIGLAPKNIPMPDNIFGTVLIKVGDKITTDQIMPAGIHLKHRSNIPEYSKVVFESFNKHGDQTFAQKAIELKNKNRCGIIVAGESYGQGSSREHAAICPMFLGIKAVIAVSIERIHSANLINFGILPLFFEKRDDYNLISENMDIEILEIREQLLTKISVKAFLTYKSEKKELIFRHSLTKEDIDVVLAGGKLNLISG